MPEPETIGQRIRRERLAQGMGQRELADAVKVGVPHISKVEADRENPSDDLLSRVAQALHLDLDELLLAARRVPLDVVEQLAADPKKAVAFLRSFKTTD